MHPPPLARTLDKISEKKGEIKGSVSHSLVSCALCILEKLRRSMLKKTDVYYSQSYTARNAVCEKTEHDALFYVRGEKEERNILWVAKLL